MTLGVVLDTSLLDMFLVMLTLYRLKIWYHRISQVVFEMLFSLLTFLFPETFLSCPLAFIFVVIFFLKHFYSHVLGFVIVFFFFEFFLTYWVLLNGAHISQFLVFLVFLCVSSWKPSLLSLLVSEMDCTGFSHCEWPISLCQSSE